MRSKTMNTTSVEKMIDHTLLKPEATQMDIQTLCEEAKEHRFKSVCVNPSWVGYSAEVLKDSETVVCTVVGFPLGANATQTKVFETKQAIIDGAAEIDMVINIGLLKSGAFEEVQRDI